MISYKDIELAVKAGIVEPESVIVCFNYHDNGKVTFLPKVESLQRFISNACEHTSAWYDEDTQTLYTGVGNIVLQGAETLAQTGCIEWDGVYDKDVARYIEDCTPEEIAAIKKAMITDYIGYHNESELVEAFVNECFDIKRVTYGDVEINCVELVITYNYNQHETISLDGMKGELTEDEWREDLEERGYDDDSIDRIISTLATYEYIAD